MRGLGRRVNGSIEDHMIRGKSTKGTSNTSNTKTHGIRSLKHDFFRNDFLNDNVAGLTTC